MRTLLFDDDLDLDECIGRHGRDRALFLDQCAGRQRRDRVLLLEAGAGRHGREHALTLRRRRPSRRHPPLRRPRDAQGRLLGGGEVAQAHLLAAAPHLRLIGLRPAVLVEAHSEVARLALGHKQRQLLRLRLLPCLLARQWHRRCSPLRRYRLPLRRPRDVQRRLLGGGEAAQAHCLATAQHVCVIRLELARFALVEAHAIVARLALRHA
eukprot:scaffold73705_cov60-Phaeocystis_antarctica.AAC.2